MLPASEPPQQVYHVPPASPAPSSSRTDDVVSRTEDPEQISPQMPRLKPQKSSVSIPIETVVPTNNGTPLSVSKTREDLKSPSKTTEKSNIREDIVATSSKANSSTISSENKTTPDKTSSSTISSENQAIPDDVETGPVRPRLSLGKTLGGGFKCDYCGESCGNNGSLVIHKIRKHGFETESMKARKAQTTSTSQKNKRTRLSVLPKPKSPTKSPNSDPIKKSDTAAKSKPPFKFPSTPTSEVKKPTVPQASSSSPQQEEKQTEVLWYENESHECEICFRVLRSWSKFVEHSKTIHNFIPKTPSPDKSPEQNAEPDEISTPSTPTPNGIDATDTVKENIHSELPSIPPASTPSPSPATDKKFECPICHVKFQKKIGLNMHCRNQHDKHVCLECSDYFDSRDDLEIHVLTHELQEQLNNSVKTNVSVYVAPEKVTQSEKPLEKVTQSEKPPEKDKRNETVPTTKFECLYCDSSYTQKPKLTIHHTVKHKLHMCNICLNGFKSSKMLEIHKNDDHKNNNEQFNDPINDSLPKDTSSGDNVVCKSCKLEFKFRSSLFLHIRQAHNMMPCTLCLDLVDKDQLDAHKLDCLDPHVSCMTCKISFKRERSLAFHMARQHPAPKKPAITISSDEDEEKEKDKSKDGEKEKDKSKDGEKEKDKSKSSKEIARIKSTSKNPFCLQCKQKFDTSSQLWDHLKEMHPAMPRYRCNNCENVFYSSGGLSKHRAKCHSKTAHDSDSDTAEEKELHDNSKNKTVNKKDEKASHDRDSNDEVEQEDTMICPISSCRKKFYTTWQSVNRHIKEVHNPSNLKECVYCVKLFVDVEKCNEHQKLHLLIPNEIQKIGNIPLKNAFKFAVSDFAEPKHICKICNSKFFTERMLNDHNASKHGKEKEQVRERSSSEDSESHNTARSRSSSKRVIESSSDDTDSDTSSILAKRKKTELNTSKQMKKKINCKYCTEEFNNFIELLAHIEAEHNTSVYLKCENCDEIYYDFESLNKHTEETHSKLSLKCSYCPRTFTRESTKVEHEVTCTKRPVESASSSDEASSDSSKTSGASSSSEPSSPSCSFCGAKFKTPDLLMDHLKEHAKKKSV